MKPIWNLASSIGLRPNDISLRKIQRQIDQQPTGTLKDQEDELIRDSHLSPAPAGEDNHLLTWSIYFAAVKAVIA